MLSSLGCLLLCGSIALVLGNAQKLPKGKRPSLKVHINTTSDSIFLKFLRPNPNVKLEGFLLGYGSNLSPNQYFPLPAEGTYTEAVVDAEPKYLIVVRPAPPPSQKKSCSGKMRTRKPLQLVIGTLTSSSVFLSWGFLINPHHDWTPPSHCPNDRFYTIRYREKDKEKKWIFQLCPSTETIVENLKPNTVYEFGVKDNVDGGIWSKIFNHKTIVGSKKVNGKIQSTYDQVNQVPAYVPRKPIPITIIKQVIQNVTHRASIKSPDRTPLGGTIVVHLIVPGLNETTIKLPASIMLEISDAIKTQLAKNETLALPAESKTPEVEKIPAQPITVLSERTPETSGTILIPTFELPLSTLAPKRLPEFPWAKTPFPFEKPGDTLASSEKPWIAPTTKRSEDSKVLQSQTATREPILDSVPPKTSRTLEWPRATLAPSDTSFVPQKLEILTIPEIQPTTPAAPQPTTSIPSTPKRRHKPKQSRTKTERTRPGKITSKISKITEPTQTTLAPSKTQFLSLKPKLSLSSEVTHTKAAPEPQTPSPSQSTIAPKKRKPPGHRLHPKATRSPEVPKSKPALEPATIKPELLVPTVGNSTPSNCFHVPATGIEHVTLRTEAPATTLVPKTTQRTRKRRPRPKPKTTWSPVASQTKPDFEPVTPGTSLAPTTKMTVGLLPKPKPTLHPEVPQTKLVPATILEPVVLRTEAPETTLAPKMPQRTRRPPHKRKTTPSPEVPHTELVPATALEPVTPIKEAAGTAFVPATDLEPVTFRTETPGTTLATTTSKRPRRRGQRPKPRPSPQVPQIKPVPSTVLKPVTLSPEAPGTTLASKTSEWTPHPRLKTTPSPDALELKSVSTEDLEPVTLRTEALVTTQAPKTPQWTRHQRLKPKKKPTPEAPVTKPVPATDLHPVALGTEAPETMVLATVLEPVSLRTEVPETTLVAATGFEPVIPSSEAPGTTFAPTELQTLILLPVMSPSLEMPPSQPVSDVLESITFSSESSMETIAPAETRYVYPTPKAPLRPEEPKTEAAVESITNVSEPPETTLAPKETPRAPPKPKVSPHPRIPQTQPAPKESQHVTSKPKTSPSPEVSYTTPALEDNTFGVEQAETTIVPREVLLPHKPDPEVSQSEPAPLETRGIPFIPMISPSPSQEELETTQAESDHATQEHFTTKIPRTTELAKTTQAPHRLYTTPVRPRPTDRSQIKPVTNRTTVKLRPKPSGMPKGNGVKTVLEVLSVTGIENGVQQPVPGDTGASRNVSVDSALSTKRPAIIPGTRHQPLPPRPTPLQRKPLPRNNVTGKPGTIGIISPGQVTSPPLRATPGPTGAASEKTETEKKQPTVSASGEEFGNITDFSSSPTRETDPLGKPRFTGPHVRYIQKPDNRPCSITDSVKRFPKEEAMEGNATSPPQNPPTNLTVVTVEGCPSFVILDWDKPLNDTVTEYEVISRENGTFSGKNKSIQTTNQTFSTVENLKPDTSYEFQVKPKNPLGEGPASSTVTFSTESADPRVSELVSGRDAIWTERPFNSDSYSECKGKQYVKRTWYKKFVGVQLCNSLRYKIYLSDSLAGKFYNIGDQRGHGEDHCQFVDSFLDGRTGQQLTSDQLPIKEGYYRAVRQEPVQFGEIGGHTQINYVQWYECGTTIPGKW
ncbi:target of Nesh-SH3 isoform X4 [Elephas maximus indicus]|uniref:target of Nesh-SH3 isoform X4 n=1 Tax=Elephas maximus indicus TaxID=99487 RepID=UPI0021166B97|nr:target of Nesh-SH3 isoform X4 [Elephas maximus indicus]